MLAFALPSVMMALSLVSQPAKPAYVYNATIASIFVSSSELAFDSNVVIPAVAMAVDNVRRVFPHIHWNLIVRNSSRTCADNLAGGLAAEQYYSNDVTAFVGPGCSIALDHVGRMAAYWNVPIYTAGGIDEAFARKSVYNTLTRMSFSLDRIGYFLISILREFNWHHIALFIDESSLQDVLTSKSLEAAIKRTTDYDFFMEKYYFNLNDPEDTITKKLSSAKDRARVFIILCTGDAVRRIMLMAYPLGMGDGEYVFININLVSNSMDKQDLSWYKVNDRKNKIAKTMFESLMVVRVRVPTTDQYNNFIVQLAAYTKQEYNMYLDSTIITPVVAAFYDCVLMYAWCLNETLALGGDPRDGRQVTRRLWNQTFKAGDDQRGRQAIEIGLTGDIIINENGDREADYTLNDLDPETGLMSPVASFFGARLAYEALEGTEIHWPGGRQEPPPDVPYCGFQGEALRCRVQDPFSPWASAGIAMGVVFLLALISGILVFRKLRYEAQLADTWWKVAWEDIVFPERNAADKSKGSIPSHGDSLASKSSQLKSTSNVSTLANLKISGILLGTYKGVRVAIKPLELKKIHITRQLLMEMKEVHDITHENLARFIGMCPDEPNICTLTELCTRGSLRDMLENEEIQIDWLFRYSIISDIVEALNFLHASSINFHGNLKSTKCVIDGRFVVKVIDYGMRHLQQQLPEPEGKNLRTLFWTAPEILRQNQPRLKGTKEGDIYSFAIILQEVITRCGPYESLERLGRNRMSMEPEEILDRVRMGTTPPFRPEVSADECPQELLRLMRQCWAENPADRPNIVEVRTRVKKITKGMSSKNFFDNLLHRMEQYANNLEGIVEEKTQSLLEEKKRTDELLYQLLPRYVADELKKGNHVQPEAFEEVTIFFSDIVGFTSLSAESSPLQVVTLLNDLYTCFDSIIEQHDVYKVETIGDAYLVASGLPIPNGNEHAREISRMALTLRERLQTFKIRHLPKRKLQLRIGIHSGPCVAGVVGLKMPKYCLFGDAVNTASRMETTGERMQAPLFSLKIHVSKRTKEILDTFGTFILTLRGDVQVKGKGMMTTYWLDAEMKDSRDKKRLKKKKEEEAKPDPETETEEEEPEVPKPTESSHEQPADTTHD